MKWLNLWPQRQVDRNGVMQRSTLSVAAWVLVLFVAGVGVAADFNFFGRSGDAIEINLATMPGISAGASFGGLNLAGFAGHTVLTSDTLTSQSFSTSGRLWVFPNPAFNTVGMGDTNPSARGFQGMLGGSLLVNGETKTFSVTVQPGYTGSGPGSVGQSLERINRAANNPLFVAQQQQRLRYLGFVRQGGAALAVDGDFGPATDEAARTFQATFSSNVNATQANASDGIIGPITAGWLNAANAPRWDELIDPDPQPPGSFSTNTMIGDFDIWPGPDPGSGARSGLTPQPERFGTSWAIDVIFQGSALAKATTGRTQRINAISTADGYGSSCCHSTHRVGNDIDLYTNSSTWNAGNGVVSAEEQIVINHALAFANANAQGRVLRILTSNQDILNGINAVRPGLAVYDSSGSHQNHLHIDVGAPVQIAGVANLPGDFNLDDVVDTTDYVLWRRGLGTMYTPAQYNTWRANFGRSQSTGGSGSMASAVPEPASIGMLLCGFAIVLLESSRTRSRHAH